MKFHVRDLLSATKGNLLCQNKMEFYQVAIDTRQMQSCHSYAFFALKGSRTDGHLFLNQAHQKNASVLVVESTEQIQGLQNQITIIQVDCTLKAIGHWAKWFRKNQKLTVVGITGSNGKTSAKHFCQTLLNSDSVCVSPKSYNNQLGVALGLLQATQNTKVVIQEIGTNHPGEIQHLCSIALPDIVVCTSVGMAHVGGFGSVENTAKEKEQIYLSCPNAIGLFYLDNQWTKNMKSRFSHHSLSFSSTQPSADICIYATEINETSMTIEGHIQNVKNRCSVALAGKHHLTSLMTAISVSLVLKKTPEEIWNRLPFCKSPDSRCQLKKINGNHVFFDAYNSNPESMKAFLEHIFLLKKNRKCILCIGDMLELGKYSTSSHQQLGTEIAEIKVDFVFYIGKYRFDFEKGLGLGFKNYKLYDSYQKEISKEIHTCLNSKSVLGIKASRGLRLERVLHDLQFLTKSSKNNKSE